MKTIITILYKPIGLIMGMLAGILGKKVFDFVWGKIDEEDPPKANTEWVTWGKLLSAAALQGMIFKVVRAAVDRETAKGFHYVTGVWPGEKTPDQA